MSSFSLSDRTLLPDLAKRSELSENPFSVTEVGCDQDDVTGALGFVLLLRAVRLLACGIPCVMLDIKGIRF